MLALRLEQKKAQEHRVLLSEDVSKNNEVAVDVGEGGLVQPARSSTVTRGQVISAIYKHDTRASDGRHHGREVQQIRVNCTLDSNVCS